MSALSKAVQFPTDLKVGWFTFKADELWIFLGRSHKLYFGSQLFRFLVVRLPTRDVRSEFLSAEGVVMYVLS